jgi:hypothetical protein
MPINRCLLIALLIVTAVLPAAPAAAATPTKIVVSLKFPAFHGTLRSAKGACAKNRTVKLYRQKAGPDKLLGTDRSSAKTKWSIPVKLTSGSYYATAPKKGTCSASKSKVVTVD